MSRCIMHARVVLARVVLLYQVHALHDPSLGLRLLLAQPEVIVGSKHLTLALSQVVSVSLNAGN
eukprot:1141935-Pelagomonas_calceolata.AAC.7